MGMYPIKLIATAANSGCIDSLSKNLIAYRSSYLPMLSDTTICKGATLTLVPQGGSNFNFYQDENATTLLGSGSTLNIDNINTAQTIYLSLTDSVFESPLHPVTIQVANIEASFTVSSTNLNAFIGDTLYLNGSNATTWNWDFDNGETSEIQQPFVIYNTAGDYNVSLQVSDIFGCTDITEQTVSVINEEPFWTNSELENTLSIYPNPSDGIINLRLNSNNYKAFTLTLISTSGHVVFSKEIERSLGTFIPINLQHIQKGMYILKFNMHQASFTQRIVLDNE